MKKFNISRRILLSIALLLSLPAFTIHIQAQHGWTVNAPDFANSMLVTAEVSFDGTLVTSGTLGAFVDDECRGFIDALEFEPNVYVFDFLVHSDQSTGEILTFRYYNPDDGLIYEVNETIEFVADTREGDANNPIHLSVTTTNNTPVVDVPIEDLSLDENFGSTTIDLSTVFSDPDDDPLTYSAVSSNIDVITVSIAGSILTIAEAGPGNSTVTVTADDGTGTTDDVFTVTVNDINEAPVVDNPLTDLALDEYFGTRNIDLTGVFSDPDGDELVLSAVSGNTGVVIVAITGTTLTITEAGIGSSVITVTASDGEYSVEETFTVTVSNVNDAPVVANPIPDREVNEFFGSIDINISDVFSDPDAGEILTYSAISSNSAVVTVSVEGAILTITGVGPGEAVITVTASDADLSVEDQFTVTVVHINAAPELTAPIPDQNMVENIGSVELDLDAYFSDPYDDELVYSVVLRDAGIVSYDLDQSLLLFTPVDLGSTRVTVTATDPEGLMAADSFMVYVEKELMFLVQYGAKRLQNRDTIFLCNDAGQIDVKVITKATWGFTNDNLWIALEIEQDSTLTVAFSSNLTGGDRIGDITLFDAQGHLVQLFVKQTEHCLTSVVPDDRQFDLKVYPNPVEDRLFIDTGERLWHGMKVEVMDQQGKLIFVEEVMEDPSGAPLEVDMRGYPAGLYYIRISDEGGTFTGKIVKK